ncbi:Sugar phosphate isomerase/epimerase [Actinopolyspora mzabensis]|uniref:Sugar phosphate isomerase/epimerase n=1 Tax=Actinopolyspora mzabensis TaxID=995066 RepID=A0A1G9EFH4_ACTMZ|nr:sugar phosphate isomerase/epimerase family protein [Actinopolyspora mzabensis]SDK74899.1 Sugar phosphate isomerase/epimerase [Actinopolyspora mzabensis]
MTANGIAQLSLNQKTLNRYSLPAAVAECVRAGIPAMGLWREPVQQHGVTEAAELVRSNGLRVSSLCRGGFLTTDSPEERAAALRDNRLAIDEAAQLGAPCLVLVVGGLPNGSKDLAGARRRVVDTLAELAPYAERRGVRLALEALHPMYCADRAVLSTLEQALDIADPFPENQVGVVVDTFHVWWDPKLFEQIERAGSRIASFQVCDWLTPLPADVLLGRGMMGDGHIDFPPIREAVRRAGYTGDTEVEIFNDEVWATPADKVVDTMIERYLHLV